MTATRYTFDLCTSTKEEGGKFGVYGVKIRNDGNGVTPDDIESNTKIRFNPDVWFDPFEDATFEQICDAMNQLPMRIGECGGCGSHFPIVLRDASSLMTREKLLRWRDDAFKHGACFGLLMPLNAVTEIIGSVENEQVFEQKLLTLWGCDGGNTSEESESQSSDDKSDDSDSDSKSEYLFHEIDTIKYVELDSTIRWLYIEFN
jgi:hypothetical protein